MSEMYETAQTEANWCIVGEHLGSLEVKQGWSAASDVTLNILIGQSMNRSGAAGVYILYAASPDKPEEEVDGRKKRLNTWWMFHSVLKIQSWNREMTVIPQVSQSFNSPAMFSITLHVSQSKP